MIPKYGLKTAISGTLIQIFQYDSLARPHFHFFEIVKAAERELQQLIEGFYKENQDMMATQQYDAAKKNFGYFFTLIEMAVVHYRPEGYDVDTVR